MTEYSRRDAFGLAALAGRHLRLDHAGADVRRRHRGPRDIGGNQPPTLESVREIAATHARWVPHGPAPRRERPDRR